MIARCPHPLPASERRARAARLRLVLTDCDGVLTDGGVYYSEAGEALRRFNMRDGMGVERLRDAGVATAILSREASPAIARRAEKLRLSFVFLGVADKRAELPRILERCGAQLAELAFVGDDVNDLELIEELRVCGLTAAPADALPAVADAVHYRAAASGGQGAFREFVEWILRLRAEAARRGVVLSEEGTASGRIAIV